MDSIFFAIVVIDLARDTSALYHIAGCRYCKYKDKHNPFEVRCHLDKGCTGEQWLAVFNYDSGTNTIFMTSWYIYCFKRQDHHSSPLHKLLYLFFLCLSPIWYKLLPNSTVFIASVFLSGPLDHVKNGLIMCSNYRNSTQRSHLSFVNLSELKINSSKTVPWSFCKAWKCELISLPWFPGAVKPYLGPISTG